VVPSHSQRGAGTLEYVYTHAQMKLGGNPYVLAIFHPRQVTVGILQVQTKVQRRRVSLLLFLTDFLLTSLICTAGFLFILSILVALLFNSNDEKEENTQTFFFMNTTLWFVPSSFLTVGAPQKNYNLRRQLMNSLVGVRFFYFSLHFSPAPL